MTNSINIGINSTADGDGIEESIRQVTAFADTTRGLNERVSEIDALKKAVKDLGVEFKEDMFSFDDADMNIDKALAELQDLNADLQKTRAELGRVAAQYHEAGKAQEAAFSAKKSKEIQAVSNQIRAMSESLKQAGANAANVNTQLTGLDRIAQENKKVKDGVRLLNREFQQGKSVLTEYSVSQREGVKTVRDKIEVLKEQANELRRAAIAYEAMGDSARSAFAQQQRENIQSQISGLKRVLDEVTPSISRTSGAVPGLVGRFNELAFAVFITQSSIRTFITAMGKVREAITESAKIADDLVLFRSFMQGMGEDAIALERDLRDAGRGLVDFGNVASRVTASIQKGSADITGFADRLLSISVNAAILSGDVTRAEEIFGSLVDAIENGDAAAADSAIAFLSASDAVNEYSASQLKLWEDIDRATQQEVLTNIILEQGEAIGEVADQFDSMSAKMQSSSQAIDELVSTTKMFAVVGIGNLMDAANNAAMGIQAWVNSLGRSKEEIDNNIIAINSLGDGVKGLITTLLSVQQTSIHVYSRMFEFTGALIEANLELVRAVSAGMRGSTAEAREHAANFTRIKDEFNEGSVSIKETFARNFIDIGSSFGIINSPLSELRLNLDRVRDGISATATPDDISRFSELAKAISNLGEVSIDDQFNERAAQEYQTHQDRMVSIFRDAKAREIAAEEGAAKRRQQIIERRNDRIEKLEEDLSIRIDRINEDEAIRIAKIQEDSANRQEQIVDNKNDKIQKAEEDHQKKLDEIERRFQLDRTKALIDRNARALFEAQLKRDEDVRKANESAEEKVHDAQEQAQKELADLKKNEQRKIDEAQKAAERRRQDAIRAMERQRQDAIKAAERQIEEVNERLEEQREQIRLRQREQEQDARDSYRKRLDDLGKWYRDQMVRIQIQEAQKRLQAIEQMRQEQGLHQNHLIELEKIYQEYSNRINAIMAGTTFGPPNGLPIIPGGGAGGGPGGTGPSGPPLVPMTPHPSVVGGAPCNVGRSAGYRGLDNEIYFCIDGVWTHHDTIYGNSNRGVSSGAMGNAMNMGARGIAPGIASNTQTRATATLNVTGDKTLESILAAMQYEVIVDLLSE